jgi:8-oxo-dGTP diphosphatase
MTITRFNIRVYGIIIYRQNILLTDEFRLGMKMTKFPGGGLELGEGTREGLKRELYEETGQEALIKEHIYTTDYFQPTRLLPEPHQLISIYYRAELPDYQGMPISEKHFDFAELAEGAQSFRWLGLADLLPAHMTLPIDQVVVPLIKKLYLK